MESTFLEVYRIDPTVPSLTERYFKPTIIPEYDQCTLVHSNRLCLVTLSPNHPIITSGVDVTSVKFDSDDQVNRLSNKVSGKFKKGGQKLNKKSVLCTVKCSNGCEYTLYSCTHGTLVEINEKLMESPNLLKDKPWSDGYIAIVLPPFVHSRRK